METRVQTATATNGAKVELATIVHRGREFTANGSTIDLERGHIVAYVDSGPVATGVAFDRNYGWLLKTFEGAVIGKLDKTGESRGFYGSKITHFRMQLAGYRWHGKLGLDWNQLIRMRRGRKL
jgi:hypothetical protein